MNGQLTYPSAPPCPRWCAGHDGDGWDIQPGAITKTCRLVIECDGGALVELERFASVEDHVLLVEDATVQLHCTDPIAPRAALLVAETINRAVEMIGAPALAG